MKLKIKFSHVLSFVLGVVITLVFVYGCYRWHIERIMQRGFIRNAISYIRGQF